MLESGGFFSPIVSATPVVQTTNYFYQYAAKFEVPFFENVFEI